MIRAIVSLSVSLALALPLALTGPASPAAAAAKGRGLPPLMLGPGDANVSSIGDEALIRMSRFGYVYIAGQQHTHLTVTHVKKRNSLRYRDTGTKRVNSIPNGCQREKVRKGISVICSIPKRFETQNMFVQVWPRLGNDYVDGRTLPRRFRLWALVDAGRDVVYGGDGNDFVNGAFDADRIDGGAGNDWLRGGTGADNINGGTGDNRVSHG